MCPIVPILTCGLLRSNFSFAMSYLLTLYGLRTAGELELEGGDLQKNLEPLTRIELVTSSLPRTRSTN